MKRRFVLGVVAAAAVLLFAGCGGGPRTAPVDGEAAKGPNGSQAERANAEVIELNMNSIFAANSFLAIDAFEPWKKLVEEKTNGRVQVNLYHGGALGGSTTVLDDVKGGLYDVGAAVSVAYFYDAKEVFPFTISGLPFAFTDIESAVRVMEKFADKYANDLFQDAVLMGVVSSDPYDLFSVKPIRTMDDVQGMKVKIGGKNDTEIVQAWGGIPVTIPLEEIYESLQRRTVDAALFSPVGIVDFKYYETAPYLTKLGYVNQFLLPLMNANFFNSLPDDLQTLFATELNPKLAQLMNEAFIKKLETANEEFEKLVAGRGELIRLSADELQKFKNPAKALWDGWVETANEKGYPGETMMRDFKQWLQEEGQPLPF